MRERARGIFLAALVGFVALGLPRDTNVKINPSRTATSDSQSQALGEDDNLPEISPQVSNIMQDLLKPLIIESNRKRASIRNDPEASAKIDWELNDHRLNFVLYGWGETHEPPFTERAFIGSITIASVDTTTGKIDLVSFTHDIRVPEVERYRAKLGIHDGNPIKIYRTYHDGGLPLLEQVIMNATGIFPDFSAAFDDDSVRDLVDEIYPGGIEIDVPAAFDVVAFYYKGKKYEDGHFDKGWQKMDGLRVVQFIKTVPKSSVGNNYPKSLEHNARKHLVLKALMKSFKNNIKNPFFLLKTATFLRGQGDNGSIEANFDLQTLMTSNLVSVATGLGRWLIASEDDLGEIGQTVYVVDSAHGDGGVEWVSASRNPKVKQEYANKFYNDPSFEVPINGDPDAANLAKGYWGSVRELVKRKISRH